MTELARGQNRWRTIAVWASIVLNAFLAAVVVGHVLKLRQAESAAQAPLMRLLAYADAKLSPEDAAAFAAVIHRDAAQYEGEARRSAEARKELVRQITADPFDPDATRRALAAWRAASNRLLDDVGDTLIQALAQVSADGRRNLVSDRRSPQQVAPPAP